MYNKNSNVPCKLPRKMSLGRVGVALALSAMVAAPGLALAAQTSNHASAHASYQLSYSSGELKSTQSAKALHLRIRRVARNHCPDYAITKNLSDRASCIKEVESDLVSQVNHPLLTKIHTGDSVMAIASTTR